MKNKKANAKETDEHIELQSKPAIIYIPEDAIEISIVATLYKDNKIIKVGQDLSLSEIRSALESAERQDVDAIYTLTDKGRELLKSMEEEYK